jgi:hypothetical protein
MVWIRNWMAKRVLRPGTGFLAAVLTLSMAIPTASADPAETRAALERVLTLERSLVLMLDDAGAAQQIDEGLAQLDLLTDEELAMMGDASAGLAELESHLTFLKEDLENGLDARAAAVGAFPEDTPTGVSLVDAGYSFCGSTRANTVAMFAARNTLNVAQGVWDVLNRGCDQVVIGIGAGGNTSAACIPVDAILRIAEVVFQGFALCDADIDSVEIEGAYDRAKNIFDLQDHVHDDLADLDEKVDDLDADLQAHHAEIKALLDNIQAGIERNYEVGLDIIRLLNTPKGRRKSDHPACDGQPCDYPNYKRKTRSP